MRQAEPAWDLAVLAPAPGRLVDRLGAMGVRARVLPFPRPLARLGEFGRSSAARRGLHRPAAAAASALYAARLAAALRRERPDVVHAHGVKMHVLSAIARPRHCSLVWHVHGYLKGRAWTERATRACASRASVIVANSQSVARDVRRVVGTRADVRAIFNAVDLETFSPCGDCADLDRLCGLPPAADGTVRAGLVGTFARWKGHHVFLDALARIPASVPLRAYIVGDSIYTTDDSQRGRDEVRREAEDRGVAARVGFSGFVDNVPDVMRALDIVVHASTEPEPFGMVIAEAMSCGRAVIASRSGGAVELFTDGVDALGHAPGDAQDLARALQALCSDGALRARLGTAARLSATRCFDPRRLAAELVPLYRTIAAA